MAKLVLKWEARGTKLASHQGFHSHFQGKRYTFPILVGRNSVENILQSCTLVWKTKALSNIGRTTICPWQWKPLFFIWFSKHVLFFWSSAQKDKVIPYSRPERPVVTFFFLNCEKINCNPLIEKASRSLSVSWDVNKKMSLGVKKLVRLLPLSNPEFYKKY